jgi:hypothetical protein
MLFSSEGRYDDCPSIGEEEPCLSQGGFQQASVFTGPELRLAVLNYEITLGRIKLSVTVVVDNPLISAN